MLPVDPTGFAAEAVQPVYFGRYVLYQGRVLSVVAGGDGEGAPAGGDGGGEGGQGGEGLGLYDLSAAPEELRPHLEAELKKIEGNATKRFQEHADYRKRWEPYEGIEGFADLPPEDVQRLVAFHKLASDPEQFEQWLRQVAPEFGVKLADVEPELEPGGGDPNAALQQMLDAFEQKLEQRFAPIESFVSTQDMTAREQAVSAEIDTAIDAVRGETEWDEDTRNAVLQLAHAYETMPVEESIQKAFEDYQRIRGNGQSELVDGRLSQPAPGLRNGRPDTAPEEFDGIGDPKLKQAALTRMRGATQTA